MQGRLSDKVVIVAGADCPHAAVLAPDLPPPAPLPLVAALIGPAGAAVSGAVLPVVRPLAD